ncbi:hypothetical protein P9112_003693 [Eukaryota sp. TZLM1-RC]
MASVRYFHFGQDEPIVTATVTSVLNVSQFLKEYSIDVAPDHAPIALLSGNRYYFIDRKLILSHFTAFDLSVRPTQRPLTVLLSSGEKKTVMIDETRPVSAIIELIAAKVGLTWQQALEFGLLTDPASHSWLRLSQTLGEQGVVHPHIYLRRRVFIQPTDASLVKSHALLWTEYNTRFVNSQIKAVSNRADVITLAALHLLSFIGKSSIKPNSIDLSQYVPVSFHLDKTIAGDIISKRDSFDINPSEARLEFCLYIEKIKNYDQISIPYLDQGRIVFQKDHFELFATARGSGIKIRYCDVDRFCVDSVNNCVVIVTSDFEVTVLDTIYFEEIGEILGLYTQLLGCNTEKFSVKEDLELFADLKKRIKVLEGQLNSEEQSSLNDESVLEAKEAEFNQLMEQKETEFAQILAQKDEQIAQLLDQLTHLQDANSESNAMISQLQTQLDNLGMDMTKERETHDHIQKRLEKVSWVGLAKNFFENNDGKVKMIDREKLKPNYTVDGKIDGVSIETDE